MHHLTILSGGSSMAPYFVKNLVGDVAQLGERRNGIAEVEGSTPFVSTKFPQVGLCPKALLFWLVQLD